jgi:hypothetical protein
MLTANSILVDGKRLATKLSANTDFVLGINECNKLSSQYEAMLCSVKKEAGPVTATGLRKADTIYQKLQMANWKSAQCIFRLTGAAHGYPIKLKIEHQEASAIRQWCSEFEHMICRAPVPANLVVKHVTANGHSKSFPRAYYDSLQNTAYLPDNASRSILWHKLGHYLEHKTPGLQEAAEEYLASRTANAEAKKLGPGYMLAEKVKEADFIHPYFGKIYSDGGTEILAMGIQFMTEAPSKLWLEDREMFEFTLGSINAARGASQ